MLAGLAPSRFGPPHSCQAPTAQIATSATAAAEPISARRDSRDDGRAATFTGGRAECRPEVRPPLGIGAFSARCAAAANSAAVW